jgi:hypothetical protein
MNACVRNHDQRDQGLCYVRQRVPPTVRSFRLAGAVRDRDSLKDPPSRRAPRAHQRGHGGMAALGHSPSRLAWDSVPCQPLGGESQDWPLHRVKELVAAGSFMIQQGRAFAYVGGTYSEALEAVGEVVAGLSTKNFAYSQSLTWDMADVYGVVFRSGGWYLKLCIDEEAPEVAVISFHPLEAPLRTNGGEVKP